MPNAGGHFFHIPGNAFGAISARSMKRLRRQSFQAFQSFHAGPPFPDGRRKCETTAEKPGWIRCIAPVGNTHTDWRLRGGPGRLKLVSMPEKWVKRHKPLRDIGILAFVLRPHRSEVETISVAAAVCQFGRAHVHALHWVAQHPHTETHSGQVDSQAAANLAGK